MVYVVLGTEIHGYYKYVLVYQSHLKKIFEGLLSLLADIANSGKLQILQRWHNCKRQLRRLITNVSDKPRAKFSQQSTNFREKCPGFPAVSITILKLLQRFENGTISENVAVHGKSYSRNICTVLRGGRKTRSEWKLRIFGRVRHVGLFGPTKLQFDPNWRAFG